VRQVVIFELHKASAQPKTIPALRDKSLLGSMLHDDKFGWTNRQRTYSVLRISHRLIEEERELVGTCVDIYGEKRPAENDSRAEGV
jgi:hypothetical protein